MVKEYESQQTTSKFFKSEQVDCKDENGTWLNAEVVELGQNKVKVHFSNYATKFDIWLEEDSDRILKQWRFNTNFQINNRVDVLDSYNMWKEAYIIDLNETQVKIHYRGYVAKYDEWIHKTSVRISEIGSKSTALGIGRTDPSNISRYSKKEIQPQIKKIEYSGDRELYFRQLLNERDLAIVPAEDDGNCLFRSVSHQLYGLTDYHDLIRAAAMKHISQERAYFSQFIVGGLEKVDEYLEHQSKLGAWGDDIEIQAMSEIYNKPFEIFAYSKVPMRTFHESSGLGSPIRLAYHGNSHYNSVCSKDGHIPFLRSAPGDYENQVLERLERGELRDMLQNSRQEFEVTMQMDLEQALAASLEHQDSEEVMMRHAIEESENAEFLKAVSQSMNEDGEEEMLRHAIEMSKSDALPHAVVDVINSGFTLEQAMEAYHLVGDNPTQMIEYIFSVIM